MTHPNAQFKTRFSNIFYFLLALAIFVTGFYLTQIHYLAEEWFTRAGCLVVILGVWSSLGVIVQERLIVRQSQWRRNRALNKFKLKHAQVKDKAQLEQERNAINSEFDKQVTRAVDHLKLSIGAREVSLLISGTLIWGFGDLLFRLVN